MVDAITEGIALALQKVFGENYRILLEEEQDMYGPCFLISCKNPSVKQFPCGRLFRKNTFCIRYFPKAENSRTECSRAAEQMFSCLKYIEAFDSLMRGTQMQYEIQEGVLRFFVSYDCFTYGKKEESFMGTIDSRTNVKG